MIVRLVVLVALCLQAPIVHAVTFPQFVLGGDHAGYYYEASLQVSSITDEETSWQVEIFETTGSAAGRAFPWTDFWSYNDTRIGTNKFTFTLPPRGSRNFQLRGTSELRVGFMQVLADRSQERRYPRLFMGHVDKGFQPGVFVRSEPGFS